jgi:membrane-associated phospholipid phosphatase
MRNDRITECVTAATGGLTRRKALRSLEGENIMQLDQTFEPLLSTISELPSKSTMARRRLLALSAGLGATVLATRIGPGMIPAAAAQQQPVVPLTPGHTWLLEASDALRPAAPGEATTAEIDELLEFQEGRSDEMVETINRWAGGQVVFPWLEVAAQLTGDTFPSALMEVRAQALLRTAMNDAVVAALDAQEAYARPLPADADDRITPVDGPFPATSSFPSLHGTVAGAASTVLAYILPEATADGFVEIATEAAESRLWAGANYRSDIEAGLALGQAIGQLAVEYGQADGTSAQWDGEGWLEGDGLYQRTPPDLADPVSPHAGAWKTWVLPSGDALRPAPFPEYDSPQWRAELATVQRLTEQRTVAQERTIENWLSQGPHEFYTTYAKNMIERERLGEAETAAVLSTVSVAMFDAFVAVWDAKYQYWTARPSTVDPEINLYVPNPPYPSYPGGFAAGCASGAGVLADIFPAVADDLHATAAEGAMIRAWCGIHYVLDNDVGLLIGGQTARIALEFIRGGGTTVDE